MVIETNITLIFWNTLGGIFQSLPYFILILLGFRWIAREIREGIKNIPQWIEQYDNIKMKHYQINKALESR